MDPKHKQVGNYYVNWNRVDTEIIFWSVVLMELKRIVLVLLYCSGYEAAVIIYLCTIY